MIIMTKVNRGDRVSYMHIEMILVGIISSMTNMSNEQSNRGDGISYILLATTLGIRSQL